jgi:type II secretory pathway component PulC
MTQLLLYFSGIVTTISLFGLIYYRNKFEKISVKFETLLKESSDVINEKKERESLKRLAKYTWTGFHYTSKPNVNWDAVYELKEVAQSEDGKKSKFEVISVTSKNTDEKEDIEWYEDWFIKKTGGGWIETANNSKLEWITTLSKSEMRNIKLNELGI